MPSAREAILTPRHKRQSSGSRREDILVTSRGPVRIRPALLSDSSSFRALRLEALKNHPEAFAAAYESEAAEPDEYWVRRLPREEADSTGALYFAESAEAFLVFARFDDKAQAFYIPRGADGFIEAELDGQPAVVWHGPTMWADDVYFKFGLYRPPLEPTPASRALFEEARRVAAGLGIELGAVRVGGASDGNFTAAAGIPTLDGLGPRGGGAHARDEHVLIADLSRRASFLAALAGGLARGGRRSLLAGTPPRAEIQSPSDIDRRQGGHMALSRGAKIAIGCGIAAVLAAGAVATVVLGLAWWGVGKAKQVAEQFETDQKGVEEALAKANANPFSPPADGVVQEDRLLRFLAVRKAIHDNVYLKHKDMIEAQAKKENPDLSALAKLPFIIAELRAAKARALADEGMSENEFSWMFQTVYGSLVMAGIAQEGGGTAEDTGETLDIPPANLELFKRHRDEILMYTMGGLELIPF